MEVQKVFKMDELHNFSGGDMHKILNESTKSYLFYKFLGKFMLQNMKNTLNLLSEKEYPRTD